MKDYIRVHRLVSLIVLLVCTQAALARVASVRTSDGYIFTGYIRLAANGVTVVNADENLFLTVPGSNVSSIVFVEDRVVVPAEESVFGVLPGAWKEAEVGAARLAGSTRVTRGTFTVRGAGAGIEGESDSFHYVYQPVEDDQEIVARVTSIQYTHPNAKAGVMMRENMGEYSRNVMMAVTAQRGGAFQARYFDGRATQIAVEPAMRPSCWVKLRRRGQEFTGYRSVNGRQWTLVQEMHVPMGNHYYVGLAVSSTRDNLLNWTTFDKVRVGKKLANEEFTPQLELTSGSVISAHPTGVADNEIYFEEGRRLVPVPLNRVTRIIYQPLSPELSWKTRISRPGVWVQGGDFFDGDLQEFTAEKVRVSSVLYGLRTFDIADEVLALVLRYGSRINPTVEVSTTDGAQLLGSSFSFGDGEVVIKEPALGELHVAGSAIRELRVR